MIKGICVGGGLEIAANCDLRICGSSSRFGAPINKLGPGDGALPSCKACCNSSAAPTALEILLEGPRLRRAGSEGERTGYAHRRRRSSRTGAYASARRIADGAPLVARWHKQFAARLADPRPLTDAERDEGYACFGTGGFPHRLPRLSR
jgi:enoyl-CoA hydratase/carnithine racemase